ncbi:hypothetical protein HanRHA438_Chr17g0831421 [Helianthus annuus]|nr:hypothetical protein HanRHA438_Chr17g0831421 [Helianthus annuus]
MVENLHHPLLNLNSPFLPQPKAPLALTNQNHCLQVACLTLTCQIHRRPFSSFSLFFLSSDLYLMNLSCLTWQSRELIHQNFYSFYPVNLKTKSSQDILLPSFSFSSVCLFAPVKVLLSFLELTILELWVSEPSVPGA